MAFLFLYFLLVCEKFKWLLKISLFAFWQPQIFNLKSRQVTAVHSARPMNEFFLPCFHPYVPLAVIHFRGSRWKTKCGASPAYAWLLCWRLANKLLDNRRTAVLRQNLQKFMRDGRMQAEFLQLCCLIALIPGKQPIGVTAVKNINSDKRFLMYLAVRCNSRFCWHSVAFSFTNWRWMISFAGVFIYALWIRLCNFHSAARTWAGALLSIKDATALWKLTSTTRWSQHAAQRHSQETLCCQSSRDPEVLEHRTSQCPTGRAIVKLFAALQQPPLPRGDQPVAARESRPLPTESWVRHLSSFLDFSQVESTSLHEDSSCASDPECPSTRVYEEMSLDSGVRLI